MSAEEINDFRVNGAKVLSITILAKKLTEVKKKCCEK
jgi:hypothetical protein